MASPMLEARCPLEWQQKIQEIAKVANRTEAEVIKETSAEYLNVTDPKAINSTWEDMQLRLTAELSEVGASGQLIRG